MTRLSHLVITQATIEDNVDVFYAYTEIRNHVAAMLHGHGNVEMDTTRDKFLKIHTTRVSDMLVGHGTAPCWKYPCYIGWQRA